LGYNKIYVNTDNNTAHPTHVKVKPSGGSYGGEGSSKEINAGDEVSLTNGSDYVLAVFNITSAHLFSLDETGWTDIGTEQTQTEWVSGQNKSFDVSSNTTAYQYYRLRITGAKESASLSNSDYVAIGHWFLLTETSGSTVHTKYTRYTYTPASSITANVLRVAGGGGGSGTRGAGGGAGGLLYSENVTLSGAKSIVVGNGGIGYEGSQQSIENGYDTVFTGLTTSIGGGHGGGNDAIYPAPGGSGGGGSTRMSYLVQGASGTSGQGNACGNGNSGDSVNGGGGGGA